MALRMCGETLKLHFEQTSGASVTTHQAGCRQQVRCASQCSNVVMKLSKLHYKHTITLF